MRLQGLELTSAKVTPRKALGSFPSTTAHMAETLGFGFGQCKGHTTESFRVTPFDKFIHDRDFRFQFWQEHRAGPHTQVCLQVLGSRAGGVDSR